ncbi:UNVERIFIED_CONTAM: hypothetical protein FKN15_059725 [Acipenser sinensis]
MCLRYKTHVRVRVLESVQQFDFESLYYTAARHTTMEKEATLTMENNVLRMVMIWIIMKPVQAVGEAVMKPFLYKSFPQVNIKRPRCNREVFAQVLIQCCNMVSVKEEEEEEEEEAAVSIFKEIETGFPGPSCVATGAC